MTESQQLEYADNDELAERLGELVMDLKPFSLRVSGKYAQMLSPHVVAGRLVDGPRLGIVPEMRTLLAAMMMAEGGGMSIAYQVTDEAVVITLRPPGSSAPLN